MPFKHQKGVRLPYGLLNDGGSHDPYATLQTRGATHLWGRSSIGQSLRLLSGKMWVRLPPALLDTTVADALI